MKPAVLYAMPSDLASSQASPASLPAPDRCQFSFADGRACRMLRWDKHPSFCLPHAREEQQLLAADEIGEQLASISGKFKTAHDVNHVLGKVFTLRAKNRISRRDAVTFAYIGQLILQSLPAVRREMLACPNRNALAETLQTVFDNDNDNDGDEWPENN